MIAFAMHVILLGSVPASVAMGEEEAAAVPEARALAFLVREVPRWSRENHCYSCHNNGDAARALYAALRARVPVPPEALADTNRWLSDPERWDHNGGEGPFSDKGLARLEFASALASAVASGQVTDRRGLQHAAARLIVDQRADGAFSFDGADSVGSPATYGRALATLVFRDILHDADPARAQFRAAIEGAERWLVVAEVESLLDASAILPVVAAPGIIGLPGAEAQRRRCLVLIARGQSTDGGWGPYTSSPPEVFDTALVVLSLVRAIQENPNLNSAQEQGGRDLRAAIARGRAFLISTQADDGSWPETTRPSGGESYAQRLSTAGWATLALLATRDTK